MFFNQYFAIYHQVFVHRGAQKEMAHMMAVREHKEQERAGRKRTAKERLDILKDNIIEVPPPLFPLG